THHEEPEIDEVHPPEQARPARKLLQRLGQNRPCHTACQPAVEANQESRAAQQKQSLSSQVERECTGPGTDLGTQKNERLAGERFDHLGQDLSIAELTGTQANHLDRLDCRFTLGEDSVERLVLGNEVAVREQADAGMQNSYHLER